MPANPAVDSRALELEIELGWVRRERAIAVGALVLLALGAVLYSVLIAAPILRASGGDTTVVAELTLGALFQVTWIPVALAAAALLQAVRIVQFTSRIRTLRGLLARPPTPVPVRATAITLIASR